VLSGPKHRETEQDLGHKKRMKLLTAFLAGLLLGFVLSWIYILSLKAKIRLYRSYIGERIDKQWDEVKKDKARLDHRHAA
jgi:hypothetical protein